MRIALVGTVASSILGFRRDLITDLLSHGCTVYAFATDYSDVTRENVAHLGAIPIDYKMSRAGINPFADIYNTLALYKLFKKYEPDLVLSYFAKPVIFATFAAKLAKIEKIFGLIEGLGFAFTEQPQQISFKVHLLRKVQILLYRLALPLQDGLIFLNNDDPIDLLKKNKIIVKCSHVLGGIGVDLDLYKKSEPDISTVSFLFIGRLLAEKGINEFIGAAKIVKENDPNVSFIVLGGLDEANPGSISVNELNSLRDAGVVNYLGHVADVRCWIDQASVFVLPSYREGMPRSTQEAMAIGRAVITTDVPGCRETVVDGVNGFIVPAWSAEKIADKMIYFINNRDEIINMGANARRFAEEYYDVKKVNDRLIRILGI